MGAMEPALMPMMAVRPWLEWRRLADVLTNPSVFTIIRESALTHRAGRSTD